MWATETCPNCGHVNHFLIGGLTKAAAGGLIHYNCPNCGKRATLGQSTPPIKRSSETVGSTRNEPKDVVSKAKGK